MAGIAQDAMLGMANRFVVTVDPGDRSLGTWKTASGLEVTWDVPEYRSGEDWNYFWSYPGIPKYPTIKLERAANPDDSPKVKKWLEETSTQYKNHIVTIKLHDAHGEKPVMEWICQGGFPKKWSIVKFDAGTSSIALETLEISHVGFLLDEKKLA